MRQELRFWAIAWRGWRRWRQPVTETALAPTPASDALWPLETWQVEPCWRCETHHPRHCDLCPSDPPCADHVCSWSDDEELDTDATVETRLRWP